MSPTCQFGLRKVERGDFCISRSFPRPGAGALDTMILMLYSSSVLREA